MECEPGEPPRGCAKTSRASRGHPENPYESAESLVVAALAGSPDAGHAQARGIPTCSRSHARAWAAAADLLVVLADAAPRTTCSTQLAGGEVLTDHRPTGAPAREVQLLAEHHAGLDALAQHLEEDPLPSRRRGATARAATGRPRSRSASSSPGSTTRRRPRARARPDQGVAPCPGSTRARAYWLATSQARVSVSGAADSTFGAQRRSRAAPQPTTPRPGPRRRGGRGGQRHQLLLVSRMDASSRCRPAGEPELVAAPGSGSAALSSRRSCARARRRSGGSARPHAAA